MPISLTIVNSCSVPEIFQCFTAYVCNDLVQRTTRCKPYGLFCLCYIWNPIHYFLKPLRICYCVRDKCQKRWTSCDIDNFSSTLLYRDRFGTSDIIYFSGCLVVTQ